MKTGPGTNFRRQAAVGERGRRGKDARPGNVRGQQVGRALDPAEVEVEGPRKGARQERLADTGHVLDQGVALGQEGDGQEAQGSSPPTTASATAACRLRKARAPSATVTVGGGR